MSSAEPFPTALSTDRLSLRLFGPDDADDLFDLFRRPEVARWSGNGQPMTDREQAVERIAHQPTRAGSHPATAIFAVHDHEGFAGTTMLVPIPASQGVERDDVEIGWHYLPRVWGRGYATEAGRAMVQRGWDAGFSELVAVTDPDNGPSQAVCGRLGMTDLGLRDDWYDVTLRAFRLGNPHQ